MIAIAKREKLGRETSSMLQGARGQSYFAFLNPSDVALLEASDSQFSGIGNSLGGLECKAGHASLHKNISESTVALPNRPIIVLPFNSLATTTVKPNVRVNTFAAGFRAVSVLLLFRRGDGQTRQVVSSGDCVRVYGFDGRRVRRYVDSLSVGEAVTRVMGQGFRSVTE